MSHCVIIILKSLYDDIDIDDDDDENSIITTMMSVTTTPTMMMSMMTTSDKYVMFTVHSPNTF